MAEWTREELLEFKQAQTLQNRPLNNDQETFEEDNPVWEVVVDGRLFIRGAKGIENTRWYQAGIKNGGQVSIADHNYDVNYLPVKDTEILNAVTGAYNDKYNGQYPIDLMVSDQVTLATVELVKK
jgi:hypothetical protein